MKNKNHAFLVILIASAMPDAARSGDASISVVDQGPIANPGMRVVVDDRGVQAPGLSVREPLRQAVALAGTVDLGRRRCCRNLPGFAR